jgi:hypothetical protein
MGQTPALAHCGVWRPRILPVQYAPIVRCRTGTTGTINRRHNWRRGHMCRLCLQVPAGAHWWAFAASLPTGAVQSKA